MTELLSWLATNKEVLIGVGTMMSPVVAVIASVVSYQAVVTGPRLQREMGNKQLALQQAQLSANLLGASDQKWIDDFRMTMAELVSVLFQHGSIKAFQKERNTNYKMDRALELSERYFLLQAKIELMIGAAGNLSKFGATGDELTLLVGVWYGAEDQKSRTDLRNRVIDRASRIIEQKQKDIAARINAPLEPVVESTEPIARRGSLSAIWRRLGAKLRGIRTRWRRRKTS